MKTPLENILERPQCDHAEIQLSGNECVLKTNGEIAAIEINYKGSLQATALLPFGWVVKHGNYQIIIFRVSDVPLQDEQKLFSYRGNFQIIRATCVTHDLKKIYCKSKYDDETNKNASWGTMRDNWEDYTSFYVTLTTPQKKPRVSRIQGKNSFTQIFSHQTQGQLCYKSGVSYTGSYCRHKEKFYTGKSYSQNSVRLYRRNEKPTLKIPIMKQDEKLLNRKRGLKK